MPRDQKVHPNFGIWGLMMGKPIEDPNRISVSEAAKRLGMTPDSLKECMKQNAFPIDIGVAIKKNGNKNYTYYVYKNKLLALEKFWGFYD